MSVVSEGIQIEPNDKMSFGNYEIIEKQKINNFAFNGNNYDLRTHNQITRLQKNGGLLFESVPGSTVHFFEINEKFVKFEIEGLEDAQVTLELEPNKEYRIFIDDVNVGTTISNISGKLTLSVPLQAKSQSIIVEKI